MENNIVNLVVHEKELRSKYTEIGCSLLNFGFADIEYGRKCLRTLEEIDRISDLPNTRYFEGYEFNEAVNYVNGADLVILYGCNREVCLDRVAEVLIRKGIPVAYSIKGTI